MNIAPIEWKISASFDDGSHMVTFPAINKGILLLKKPEMTDIGSLIGLAVAARDAQVQAALADQEPVAWRPVIPRWPCNWSTGKPDQETLDYWRGQQVEVEYAYTNPLPAQSVQQEAAQPEPSTPAAHERAEPIAPAVQAALDDFLEAQDAFDNHEASGINGEDYFVLLRRRNAARRDLDAALSATPPAPAQPSPEPSNPEQAEAPELPRPGSPEASAMIDSVLAEYNWPCNPKNAARAGFEAARRMFATKPQAEQPATPPAQTVQDGPTLRWCSECGEGVTTACRGDERACVFNWVAIRAARTRGDEVGKSASNSVGVAS